MYVNAALVFGGPLITTSSLTVTQGYNYFGPSTFNNMAVTAGWVPMLINGDIQIAIDISNGTQYSDFTFVAQYAGYFSGYFNRINANLNCFYAYDTSLLCLR